MKDNSFDPTMLKQVAGAMSQALTENSINKAKDRKVVNELTAKVDSAETVTCDNCRYHVFENGIILKRFSAITSPTGQEVVVPVEIFKCSKCGHINEEFLPSYAISDVKRTDSNGLPTY